MELEDTLFTQGFGTRRECAALASSGLASMAGEVLHVQGVAWPVRAQALVMLHKPAGYECSQKPGAHPTVMTLLPPPLRRRGVQPVGRLDVDTTGLLLLTDDGVLLHRLTSPKHHVPKVYEARVKHPVSSEQIAALLAGVVLDDDPRPVRAAAASALGEHALSLTLTEGKYHQVKRMVAAVGNRVEALHRSRIGALMLPADLQPGQWRWLGADDQAALQPGAVGATGAAGA